MGDMYINGAEALRRKLNIFSPLSYGARGNGTGDDYSALMRCFDAAGAAGGYRADVNMGARVYQISQPLVINNASQHLDLHVLRGRIRPKAEFPVGEPLVRFASGGNIYAEHLRLEGYKDGANVYGNQIANGVHTALGFSHLIDVRAVGTPSYAFLNEAQGVMERCIAFQWLFNSAENADPSKRTAKLFWLKSGDITLSHCEGAYALYPLVVDGNSCVIEANHLYNGAPAGTATANGQTYSALFTALAFNHTVNNTQFDNGMIRLEKFQQTFSGGCKFLLNRANANNPAFFEFAPQSADHPLAGLNISNNQFSGSTIDDLAFSESDFFRVDTTLGTIKRVKGAFINNNTYARGGFSSKSPPSTRGSIVIRVPADQWVEQDGGYRSGNIDLAKFMFLPANAWYAVSAAVSSRETTNPLIAPQVTVQKATAGPGIYQFWSPARADLAINFKWEGSRTEFVKVAGNFEQGDDDDLEP